MSRTRTQSRKIITNGVTISPLHSGAAMRFKRVGHASLPVPGNHSTDAGDCPTCKVGYTIPAGEKPIDLRQGTYVQCGGCFFTRAAKPTGLSQSELGPFGKRKRQEAKKSVVGKVLRPNWSRKFWGNSRTKIQNWTAINFDVLLPQFEHVELRAGRGLPHLLFRDFQVMPNHYRSELT
jgi:hypothetical protein